MAGDRGRVAEAEDRVDPKGLQAMVPRGGHSLRFLVALATIARGIQLMFEHGFQPGIYFSEIVGAAFSTSAAPAFSIRGAYC